MTHTSIVDLLKSVTHTSGFVTDNKADEANGGWSTRELSKEHPRWDFNDQAGGAREQEWKVDRQDGSWVGKPIETLL